ncbi:MAG: peptidoglycan DD-metalloendopeptidase family protein [bacterium]
MGLLGLLVLLVGLFVPAVAGAAPRNPTNAEIAAAQRRHAADVAALGRLSGQLAAVDADIERTRTSLDAAIAAYNETSRRLQQATAEVERTGRALAAAQTAVDDAREQARVEIRRSYMRGPVLSLGGVAVSDDPTAQTDALAMRRYLAVQSEGAVARLQLATVTASNARAATRLAEERATALQVQAGRERDQVLRALADYQARQAALAAERRSLERQAALAYGRVRQLRSQRAAFVAWAAEVARKRAAERARQAALARQRERQRQRELARQNATAVAPPASVGSWGNPMSPGTYSISTCFCMRWGVFHWGVDFAADYGTPIHAIASGRVVAAGPAQGFGNWVVIDHGSNTYSVYGHMRVLKVYAGERVRRGQLIALVGSEGQSTGPHMHLEIRIGGIEGTKIDPQVFLAQRGIQV